MRISVSSWATTEDDSEQTPSDLAAVADYTHLTALRAPRPTLLTHNAHDSCCFRAGHALGPLLRAAMPVFALYERRNNLRHHVNQDPGHKDMPSGRGVFSTASSNGSMDRPSLSANSTWPEDRRIFETSLNASFNSLRRHSASSIPADSRRYLSLSRAVNTLA